MVREGVAILMMEQPEVGVCEDHLVFISSLDAFGVHDTARWCSEVSDTTLPGSMDVIGEWEECIGGARNAIQLGCMLAALLSNKCRRDSLEQVLPLFLFTPFELLSTDEQIDSIRLFGPLDALLER